MRVVKGVAVLKEYVFASGSSDARYETLILENGDVTCNCPGWTKRMKDGVRSCKHTKAVLDGTAEDVCISVIDHKEEEEVAEIPEEPKPAEWSANKLKDKLSEAFATLRDYGFVAYQGLMWTRNSAMFFMADTVRKRNAQELPVSGLAWTDRYGLKKAKAKELPIQVHYKFFGDSYPEMISEVFERAGFQAEIMSEEQFVQLKGFEEA